MKLTQDSIEALYFTAFTCYNQGKFADAAGYFRLLTTHDPKTKKHWMGLAASLQMQKQFQRAIEAYEIAAALEPADPYVHFQAAHCLQSLGHAKDALFALDCAKRALKLNPATDSLKNLLKHIHLISKTLKVNIKKM
jgi:type III secretion system low calcium response chaperone LcrH/SycD